MAAKSGPSNRPRSKDTPRVNVTLVTVDPEGKTRDAAMKRARFLIGRREGCDVRIAVASISREHCELRVEDGRLFIKDLGSSNGTYVNRQRIQEVQLSPGDLIAVGPAVFVTRIEGEPADIDPIKSYHAGSAPQPVAAASSPGARPASPTAQTRMISPSKPGNTGPGKGAGEGSGGGGKKSLLEDEADDELDLRPKGDDSADSSASELDFDFLDEDEDDKKKL
jgi:pSer/pThr/pTyr-binding forkhead associated (FHA) protein